MADMQNLSLLDGGPVELPPSVWHALQAPFDKFASANAVMMLHQDASHLSSLTTPAVKSGHLIWTFDELLNGAIAVVAKLRSAGVKPGATVVTLLPNGAEYFLMRLAGVLGKTNLAALDVGAVGAARKLELQNYLTQLKPDVVLVTDKVAALSVDAAIAATGHQVMLKLDAHWDKETAVLSGWSELNQINKGRPVDAKTRQDILADALVDDHSRTAITLFTSGTSIGKPKGCPRTVKNMLFTLDCLPLHKGARTNTRYLADTANFRAICSVLSTGLWLQGGCVCCSGPSSTPAGAIMAFDELKITDTVLVPALARLIAAHPLYSTAKVSSLRAIASGGDVVTRSVLELIDSTFPNARAVNAHGMSEGGNLFDWSFMHDERRYFGEVAAFGKVMRGARLKVVDENGKIVPRGTPGELHIDSPGTIPHYLDNVQPATFYNDGDARWFKTGDTTIIDNDGYTYIIGRSKDIIKRAGIPITPLAVESCIDAYIQAQSVVLGVDHEVLGSTPYAVLTHLSGKSIDQIKDRVVEMMGKDYALEDVVTLEQLGFKAWPLNATDKVNRVELKTSLLQYLATRKL